MSKSKQNPKKTDKKAADSFVWTDDEVELLLKVTMEYKTSRAIENIDWESCQTKYGDILQLFVDQYPTPENAVAIEKDFPHKKEQIVQSSLTSKLKMIRKKFRQAVDAGRKSGHGRVVLLYFELCKEIWGGSPATTTIADGIETTDVDLENCDSPDSPVSTQTAISDSPELESVDSPESDAGITDNYSTPGPSSSNGTVKERRDLLNARLTGHKREKLKRKLPVDTQLLSVSQEELQIKKQLLEKMENMDKAYSNHMDKLTSNMEKLTGSISDGFALMRQIMCPVPDMMQSHYMVPQPQANYMVPHTAPANTPPTGGTVNNGHFSFTQSLYSNDDTNIF